MINKEKNAHFKWVYEMILGGLAMNKFTSSTINEIIKMSKGGIIVDAMQYNLSTMKTFAKLCKDAEVTLTIRNANNYTSSTIKEILRINSSVILDFTNNKDY